MEATRSSRKPQKSSKRIELTGATVRNESEFCKDWLKRSDSYMRQLRFNQAVASTNCLAICASKLRHYAKQMRDTVQHRQLGDEFLFLSARCTELINKEAEATWLAA